MWEHFFCEIVSNGTKSGWGCCLILAERRRGGEGSDPDTKNEKHPEKSIPSLVRIGSGSGAVTFSGLTCFSSTSSVLS